MTNNESAYDEGWRAYRSNKARTDNPYNENTEDHFSWAMGWVQGEWDSYMPEDDYIRGYEAAK